MRPDGDVDAAIGEPGEHLLAIGTRNPIREEFDTERPIAEQVARVGHGHAFEHRAHAGGVLFGEYFGRRQQRSLVSAIDRCQHCGDGHDRLAGTNITLEEPMHRLRTAEVSVDLIDGPRLGAGQWERQ